MHTPASEIFRKLEDLHARRETWENGVYKDATEQAYDLLQETNDVLEKVRSKRILRKALDEYLRKRGFTVQANTSLTLKGVRLVFGKQGRRELGYARVLDVYRAEKRSNQSLKEFIYERGGIEEIRRTPKGGVSAADKARMNQEVAETKLASAASLGSAFKAPDMLKPDREGTTPYSVALVRENKDGTSAIVWGTGKQALVNAVLKEAGKAISEADEAEAVVTASTTRAEERHDVIEAMGIDTEVAEAA